MTDEDVDIIIKILDKSSELRSFCMEGQYLKSERLFSKRAGRNVPYYYFLRHRSDRCYACSIGHFSISILDFDDSIDAFVFFFCWIKLNPNSFVYSLLQDCS